MTIRRCALAVTLAVILVGAGALAQSPAPGAVENYAWADSCRTCHEAQHAAWLKTKHATALNRLSGAEQDKECIGCHVTGPKTRVLEGTTVLNGGVQCESCHGPARAHAKDPAVRTGLKKIPPTEVCEQCHSDKSPRFKGFFYGAMAPLSHKHK
jgi:hypothetical protein